MDQLIEVYQHRFNLKDAIFSRIDHEDAMVAIVYKVIQPMNRDLILKISTRPKDYWNEMYFLKQLVGKIPVPIVVKSSEPEANLPGAILMQCLPGSLLKAEDLSESMAYELGSILARLHLNRVPGYGDLLQHLYPDPRAYFTFKFEESLAECSENLPRALLEQCRQYYDAHVHLLDSADGPCLIHRDFRPGNIMVNEGKLQGIIDWSSGRASFAEEDFCPIEHGEWLATAAIKQAFFAGYATVRPVPNYSAMMPLLRLSKALATIGFIVKTGTWENTQARLYQFNRLFLETMSV